MAMNKKKQSTNGRRNMASRDRSMTRGILRRTRLLALLTAVLTVAATGTAAAYELETASSSLGSTQAGAHTDYKTEFKLKLNADGDAGADLRNTDVILPAGLVGNAQAAPTCSMAQVTNIENPCPNSTIVGYMFTEYAYPFHGGSIREPQSSYIYNIRPYKDEPAAFGAYPFFPVRIDTSVGPESGYRVKSQVHDLVEPDSIDTVKVTLFGVPADINGQMSPGTYSDSIGREIGARGSGQRVALMTNPTQCTGSPIFTDMLLQSWGNPSVTLGDSPEIGTITGCDKLLFAPSVTIRPTQLAPDVPAGYAIDLNVPQNEDPNGLATPALKDARITFPQGVVLSPGVADGLGACSDGQFGLHSDAAASCPDSAKIGTLAVMTPLLSGALQGSVYVGEQLPGNPYRVFFYIHERGVTVKLEGRITLDPTTGQVTATFVDNPQIPFSNFHVQLKGGEDAPLSNPSECGVKTTTAQLTSYAGQVAAPSDAFSISGCAERGFAPGWNAGSTSAVAGGPTGFSVQVTRKDGEQDLSRIEATLPEGLLAKLAGVPTCPDAQAVTGSCAAASEVGSLTAAVGSGPDPLYIPEAGKAPTALYLGGPYKGAPISLVAKVPAQAGPFDLGTVVVRSGVYVDPVTTRATVKSDLLPQILEGIPLSYRDLRIEVNRTGFMVNPTSCDPMSVDGTIVSDSGHSADVSKGFQTVNCERLGFEPKLALGLSGPTHRSAHPKLRAVLTTRKGDANIGRAQVTLPKTEFLENAHIQTVCTRVQFAADACPAKSIYGYAKAWTPLLDKPI